MLLNIQYKGQYKKVQSITNTVGSTDGPWSVMRSVHSIVR